MNATVARDALLAALATARAATSTQSAIPILSCVLIQATSGRLRISATDTEVALSVEVAADVGAGGAVAVDASALHDVVRSMAPHVQLSVVGRGGKVALELSTGSIKFKLPGHDDAFPPFPGFERVTSADLPASELCRLIEQTEFAVHRGPLLRPGFDGAQIETELGQLRMVATDGHVLAAACAPFEGDFRMPLQGLIPRPTLATMRKALDVRDVEPIPGSTAFCDPPYQGCPRYAALLPRADVLALALRWGAVAEQVIVSEAEPLPLEGWTSRRLRVAGKPEWVTCLRPPGQGALLDHGPALAEWGNECSGSCGV